MKRILYLLFFVPALLLASFTNYPLDVLESILRKMQQFNTERPQEKLYLHFDKPFYAAGENVWFKAYLMEASLHTQDSVSRVVYVELVDQTKTILQRKVLYAANGMSFGDLQLPDTLQQGKYLIRAYTNYMKNIGEDFFFMKEFSILTSKAAAIIETFGSAEAIAKEKIHFDRDSIDLQFFPEGGNMIACGVFNRLAFKALSPDGKSIAIEGEILDEKNSIVTTFQTQHDGMGLIKLNPTPGKIYSARITKPYVVNRVYTLPRVNEKGYVMQVDEIGKNIKVVVFTNMDKPASGQLDISIVAQSHGKVYHAQRGIITSNAFFTYIPLSKFPEGITQITLFDSKGRPVAERLIHQNQQESITVGITTDTSLYAKRQLVTMYIEAVYPNRAPAKGNFSIAVYDEGLLGAQEKYPLTINSYLSLTSDLKGNIENPGYYFNDSIPDVNKHKDLLMMVHGWRRFTWNDVLDDNRAAQKYNREQGLPINGRVLKAGGKKAPEGSNLKIMTMNGNAVIVKPDSTGKFYTDGLSYYDSMELVFQTENEKGKKQPYKFLLDPFNPPPPPQYTMTAFTPFDASLYLKQQSEEQMVFKASEVTVLKEVVVEEKKERDTRYIGFGGNQVIKVKKENTGYTSIFQMIQSQVPGVIVTGNPPNMTVSVRGQTPLFLMNGSITTPDMVGMMSPTDIEGIELIRGGAVMYGASSVINLVLRAGAWDRVPIGMNQAKYPGFYQAREFYSPRYDVPNDRHNLPDKRTTLFWEPMIETDRDGTIAISFYTADVASRYRIIMEGISHDGYPGTATQTFEVK